MNNKTDAEYEVLKMVTIKKSMLTVRMVEYTALYSRLKSM
jgi:hypothetical protein